MKLTTGILITILMAGSATAQQQASTPSFWDTLRAKIMGGPAPKPAPQHPATTTPTNGAKPATTANAKPSPAQPAAQHNVQQNVQQKGATPVTSAAKTQAQPAQVQPVKAQGAQTQMASAPANKNQAPQGSKAASAPIPAKNQAPQVPQTQAAKAQIQPAKAPATNTQIAPVVVAKAADTKASTSPVKAVAVDPKVDAKAAVLQKVAENAKAAGAKAAADAKTADNKSADAKASDGKSQVAVEDSKTAASTKSATKEFNYTGQRDPFISPVRTAATGGSGCSTGKRCLAIDQINLKGVIKSDGGMIAVVTNSMDKAYFLRENDPVFNGYVVKITGDSVIFSETYEDKLGKPLTREVTKKLTTPAV